MSNLIKLKKTIERAQRCLGMCTRAHQLAARLLNICFAKALWTPVLLQLQLYVDKEKPLGIHASRAKSLQV